MDYTAETTVLNNYFQARNALNQVRGEMAAHIKNSPLKVSFIAEKLKITRHHVTKRFNKPELWRAEEIEIVLDLLKSVHA